MGLLTILPKFILSLENKMKIRNKNKKFRKKSVYGHR